MNLELVTNLLQRNVPDFVNDQVKFWIDMAQEAIRRDEREKIVAWLRKEQEWHPKSGYSGVVAIIYSGFVEIIADEIAAGEHSK
jgi:hypothetical protein